MLGVGGKLKVGNTLLMPINGPIDFVVDRRGFTGSAKDHL